MLNILPIYSKLISESLLSLYPIFVKKINLPIDIQLWIRLISYVLISLFFINYIWISNNLFSLESIGLSIVNIVHIFTSYEGFLNLDSGVSFSIFNIYPILILLFSGINWKKEYFLSFIGLSFFILANNINGTKSNNHNFIYGLVMILIAAITEALIYFFITNIKTNNSWNHLFIGYFLGSILSSIYIFKKYIYTSESSHSLNTNQINLGLIGLGLLINAIIGSVGYWLRFYSGYRLEPGIYSILSFFGIIMAYFYGMVFGGENIDIYKIIGTLLIILSNYLNYQ